MSVRKTLSLITLAFLAAALFCACSDKKDEQDSSRSHPESSVQSSKESEKSSTEEINAAVASLSSPAGLDKWFTASKYSTSEKEYANVPVRIISVTRGEKAQQRVSSLTEKSKVYTYRQPEKGCEWVIAQYELSLYDFPVDEGGADASVTSFIVGTDGGSITQTDGTLFSDVTMNFYDEGYVFEGTVKGEIAYTLPVGMKDYLLALGEYGETTGYFSEKQNL